MAAQRLEAAGSMVVPAESVPEKCQKSLYKEEVTCLMSSRAASPP